MAHLWTGGPQPPAYTELTLCRDVYHCTPAQLDEQDPIRVMQHLTCLAAEADVRAMYAQIG